MSTPMRYVSPDEDSARWLDFALRDGDVVVSTRSKHGTTWVQLICALLVHGTSRLPDRLGRLSPWLDHLIEPREQVVARLAAQPWRRVIKTHTPLDGLVLDPRAHYVVVARHPLDAAVSLYHHGNNIDRERVRELTGGAPTTVPARPRPPLHEWLLRWIADDDDPRAELDSLPGVLRHLDDAWTRRATANLTLLHYADLEADLAAQMRRLAVRLGVTVDDARWPELIEAAGFPAMRAGYAAVAPNAGGVLKDPAAFFRRGRSGAGPAALGPDELAGYARRVRSLAPADLLAWLHRPDPLPDARPPRVR